METLSRIAMLVDVASALYPRTSNTLKAIGLLVVLRQIVNLLLSFYRAFLRRRRNLPQRYGRNSWALITGSSEGIGKGIALNLAKQGFNIILSARSEFKLDVARCDIRRSCPQVDIKTFVMDYSRASEPEYLQQRLNELYGLDVAIVVNNVGVDVLDHYHELTEKQVLNLIDLNCTATAQMNRLFIPRMLERYNKRGHKSAIVNVASLAGEIPMPMHNVYSASKAFVDCLSRALSYEYAGKIDVIALNPSEVCTAMTFHKKDIFTVSPEQCAEGLMNDLGHDRRTNGHIAHKLQAALYHFVPQGLFNHLWMSYVAPQFMAERRRAQKK